MTYTRIVKSAVKDLNKEIDRLTAARNALVSVTGNGIRPKTKRRVLSRAARERIAQAQRDRWARVKRIKKAA